MTPEAQQAIKQVTDITGNDTESVRRMCEYMGHEPAEIAHMAIARMYAQLFADEFSDEPPSQEELDAAGAIPAPIQAEEVERLIKGMEAAGERQKAISEKFAP